MILNEHAHPTKGGGVGSFTNVAGGECIHVYSTYRLTILAAFTTIGPEVAFTEGCYMHEKLSLVKYLQKT